MTNGVKIAKSDLHCLSIGSVEIGISMFLEKSSDSWGDLREAVLGHGGEEVVFDLEIEIGHPPVYEGVVADIHRVVASISYPVDMHVLWYHRKVGVRHSKVRENIGCTYPNIEKIAKRAHSPPEVELVEISNGRVSTANPESFYPLFLSDDAPRV